MVGMDHREMVHVYAVLVTTTHGTRLDSVWRLASDASSHAERIRAALRKVVSSIEVVRTQLH